MEVLGGALVYIALRQSGGPRSTDLVILGVLAGFVGGLLLALK